MLGRPGDGRWQGRVGSFNDQFNKIQVVVRMIGTIIKLPIFIVSVFMVSMYLIDGVTMIMEYYFLYQAIVSLLIFMVGDLIIAIVDSDKKKQPLNQLHRKRLTKLVTNGVYNYF